MFDDSPMRHGFSSDHNYPDSSKKHSNVNIYLAINFNIYHILAQMTSAERKHRIESYLQDVEFASLDELARHVEASVLTVRRELSHPKPMSSLSRRAILINWLRRKPLAAPAPN